MLGKLDLDVLLTTMSVLLEETASPGPARNITGNSFFTLGACARVTIVVLCVCVSLSVYLLPR